MFESILHWISVANEAIQVAVIVLGAVAAIIAILKAADWGKGISLKNLKTGLDVLQQIAQIAVDAAEQWATVRVKSGKPVTGAMKKARALEIVNGQLTSLPGTLVTGLTEDKISDAIEAAVFRKELQAISPDAVPIGKKTITF